MTSIENLLKTNGFILDNIDSAIFFGDYLKIFSFNDIDIRIVNSKNQFSFDIRKKNSEWFDIGLLKCLINKEENLTCNFELVDFQDVLKLNIDTIKILFDEQNYINTESQLKKLEQRRVKQLFNNFN
jgi:hypothetical protein